MGLNLLPPLRFLVYFFIWHRLQTAQHSFHQPPLYAPQKNEHVEPGNNLSVLQVWMDSVMTEVLQ